VLRRSLLDRPRHDECTRGAHRADHWSHQYTTRRSFSDPWQPHRYNPA